MTDPLQELNLILFLVLGAVAAFAVFGAVFSALERFWYGDGGWKQ